MRHTGADQVQGRRDGGKRAGTVHANAAGMMTAFLEACAEQRA